MLSANAKLSRVSDTIDGGTGLPVEPLALADAINYLNLPATLPDVENALIADMITSARMHCESDVNRSFITTTWDYTIDLFPGYGYGYLGAIASVLPGYAGWGSNNGWDIDLTRGAIQLPMPPLIAITSMAYVDLGGTVRAIDITPSANQVVISAGTPGRIVPAFGNFFPFTRPTTGAVVIRYTAGYGPTPDLVPRNVVMAIRLMVGLQYNRGSSFDDIPAAVARLLDPVRWGAY